MGQIIGNGLLITLGDENEILEDGAIFVEESLIKDFGKTADVKSKYPGASYFDVQGRVIMPGMVNSHMHLYSTFARGMMLSGAPPKNFMEILHKLWWRLDKKLTMQDIKYSAYIPLIQAIKSGTTTLIDHHASPFAVRGSLDTIGSVFNELGMRGVLCYEVSDRDGQKIADEGITENIEFIKNHQDTPLLRGLFGLHASFTLSDKTLDACKTATAGLDTGFHIHTAEDLSDVQYNLEHFGKRVVERLYDKGLLGPKSIAAHCIHINEREMELLQETGTNAVHNPQSNMNNAVGAADILKMLKKGVLLGLGTDGMTANMFDELKVAPLLQRQTKHDPSVAFAESCELLVHNNPKIAAKFFDKTIGTIEKGAYADVIIVDYFPPTPMNENNFYGHLLFGIASSPVDSTMVNGKFVYKNKKLLTVDEKKIAADSAKSAQKLWERI